MKCYRHLSQIVTLAEAHKKNGRKLVPDDLSIISDGAIVFDANKILWVGPDADIPELFSSVPSHDLTGYVLTPGLVDSHTHVLFGGNRAQEYAQRLNGVDYQKIASSGGGILFTMKETLKQSDKQLFDLGIERIERIESYGIKTIEMKSGYALTSEGELRLLRVMKKLKEHFSGRVKLFSTFLGAHAVPQEYESSSEFLDEVVIPTLNAAAKESLVDAVDIFHENGYFSDADARKLFTATVAHGLKCKIHADEFHDNGSAALAVEFKALSADHLLRTGEVGIQLLARSETVATLLPGTAFFLGKPLANARGLLDAGAKVAIATDFNPGSCHCDNLLMIASISAPTLKMNQAEVWAAITLNAAHALGFMEQGVLLEGFTPSFSLFKANDVSEVTYNWGQNLSVELPG